MSRKSLPGADSARPARPRLPEETGPAAFRRALLRWYRRARRDLPWRRTSDPWAIWVSEVMLQQTRVEVVRPRFEAFLAAYPHPEALARAPEEEVLALWSGLGYYTRARHLRRGAAIVVQEHGGRFPADLGAVRRLPGVGPYTAAAILSIAFGVPLAVVDGNVRRVLARLFRLDPPDDRPASQAARAQTLLDPNCPGDANQAMMELGALVCLPREPACGRCPVARLCRAHRDGVTDRYPRPRRRPAVETHRPDLYLWRDARGRLLLERGRWTLLPHLWLPVIRDPGELDLPARFSLDRAGCREYGRFRHAITRHRIEFRVLGGELRPGAGKLPTGFRLCDDSELRGLGRSSLLEKALGRERESEERPDPARGRGGRTRRSRGAEALR